MARGGLPALPAEDEAGTVVTARALAITASDSDTRSPGCHGSPTAAFPDVGETFVTAGPVAAVRA
jgi:hypothetical protein